MKKQHQRDKFERKILGFWERRVGQPIDQATIDAFASYFWREKVAFELATMRSMVPLP